MRRPRLLAAGLAALMMTGCASTQTRTDTTYTFDQSQTSIQVATPRLRALKRSAGVDACPEVERGQAIAADGLASITLPCFGGGRSVDLSQLRGEPTVVNVWAQYCGPCRDELPILQQVADDMRGRVRFLGIDYTDAQPEMAMALLEQEGVTYPQLADPTGALSTTVPVRGLPMTFFVAPDGAVTAVGSGAFTSAGQLRQHIAANLGVKSGAATASEAGA